jgi:hypothetical protein
MTHFPELAERDATGSTAEIYAEIRRLGGVPMVALIFRHFATLPGALEWMWEALGPAWRRGEIQERAWSVARAAPLVPLARIPRDVLAATGVDAAAEGAIRAVLSAYNRANPVNLLTIQCVLRLADGHAADAAAARREWSPPPPGTALPPMTHPSEMPPQVLAVLDLVAAPGAPGEPRVVQSLYRHLVEWPAFLALAVTLLRQRFDDGSIDRSVGSLRDAMGGAAVEVVASVAAPPAPHPGIRPACERFAGAVIPQMVVAGRLMEEALPPALG